MISVWGRGTAVLAHGTSGAVEAARRAARGHVNIRKLPGRPTRPVGWCEHVTRGDVGTQSIAPLIYKPFGHVDATSRIALPGSLLNPYCALVNVNVRIEY